MIQHKFYYYSPQLINNLPHAISDCKDTTCINNYVFLKCIPHVSKMHVHVSKMQIIMSVLKHVLFNYIFIANNLYYLMIYM